MAGKYATLAAESDYLKDLESAAIGTGKRLSSTELARGESFADAYIGAALSEYEDKSAWDETNGGTAPPIVKQIALMLGAWVCQSILRFRDNRDPDEARSTIDWLFNQAAQLLLMIEKMGVIELANGTLQYPDQGGASIRVSLSTPSAIANDADLCKLWRTVTSQRLRTSSRFNRFPTWN